ncbi:MAG: DUF6807 family protein, partial [Planctomycetia bacterium]
MEWTLPRVRVVPLPDDQTAILVDGDERLRWHHAPHYPRPFFFPLNTMELGPLTRMGHPSAPDHDHHRSIWFAHAAVEDDDYWAEGKTPRIRQSTWVHYEDGDRAGGFVVDLGWFDAQKVHVMTQRVIALVRVDRTDSTDTVLDLQSTFTTTVTKLELRRSNFGFLA